MLGVKHFSPFMFGPFGVVHNFPFYVGKWANTPNPLLSQLNPMEFFEEIISRIPQGREKVEDCIVVFLDSICNHCDSIGFNC